MRRVLSTYALIITLGILACTSGKKEEPIAGKYIDHVNKETIVFEDGTQYVMEVGDETRVFYLVRHSEKDTFPKHDPDLTPEGVNRSNRLFEMLKGTRIDDIYSTLYMRTLSTAEPLANGKGLKMKPYEARQMRDLYNNIIDSTRAKRVLLVGHSNNIPAFANFMAGKDVYNQTFDEEDYDHFVIVLDHGETKEVLPLRFSNK